MLAPELPALPQQYAGCSLAKLRVYKVSSRKSTTCQCPTSHFKKEKAIRQDVCWTAGVILAYGQQGPDAVWPRRPPQQSRSAQGSLQAHPGCEELGHRGKLVNVSQTSAQHLELPHVTCSTALNGFMHPHPTPDSGRMQRNWPL